MMRKAKNGMIGFGRSSGGKDFSPLISPSHSWVRIRLPSLRHGDLEMVGLCLGIRDGEQDERRAPLRLPMRLERGDLGRLMLARVQPMQIADDELERREPDERGSSPCRA